LLLLKAFTLNIRIRSIDKYLWAGSQRLKVIIQYDSPCERTGSDKLTEFVKKCHYVINTIEAQTDACSQIQNEEKRPSWDK
jgi:hypothetical protein